MEFISENLKLIILAVIALFAGITVRIKMGRTKKNKTIQKGNIVGGDMAGRDINKIAK
jgi:hypothetical protein